MNRSNSSNSTSPLRFDSNIWKRAARYFLAIGICSLISSSSKSSIERECFVMLTYLISKSLVPYVFLHKELILGTCSRCNQFESQKSDDVFDVLLAADLISVLLHAPVSFHSGRKTVVVCDGGTDLSMLTSNLRKRPSTPPQTLDLCCLD